MKLFKKSFALFAALMMGAAAVLAPLPALAATTNYPPSAPVVVLPFVLAKQYTATTAGVIKFALPFKARVLSVQANARASGGTTPTLTVDVLNGATSMLSAPMSITAGTIASGTVATAVHADESTINVNLAIGGTNPTWDDITVVLTVLRL
jgi:hypothetical protein